MPRGEPRARTEEGKANLIGERVRQRRIELKITQKAINGQLALLTEGRWNPAEQEIYRIEMGRRLVTDIELAALAEVLSTSTNWLLTGETQFDNKTGAPPDSATVKTRDT